MNEIPKPIRQRSAAGRIFRWLYLAVGTVAVFITGFELLMSFAFNQRHVVQSTTEEYVFIAIRSLAALFLLYLVLAVLRRAVWLRRVCAWLFTWQMVRRGLIALAGLITLAAMFYTEENWRGRRVWENCKRELEAKGAVLDWAAYIPPPVPDDQNIFKAPKMQEWFVGRGANELSKRLSTGELSDFVWQHHPNSVAEVTVVSLKDRVVPESADLVLRCQDGVLTILTQQEEQSMVSEPESPVFPLIAVEDVPLAEAIGRLARLMNVSCSFDPRIEPSRLRSTVNFRWENISARQALLALLNNYNLLLIRMPDGGIGISPSYPEVNVRAAPAVYERLGSLIRDAIERNTNRIWGATLKSSLGFTLSAGPLNPGKPVRVVVRSEKTLTTEEVADFFPDRARLAGDSHLRVASAGDHAFGVFLNSPTTYSAGDYLAWSDQFEADFDMIRAALKRPYARIEGEYQVPLEMPNLNFVCLRITVQTLADRAKSYLLLGQPENALHELTLIHDLCRLLEAKPTGKPMTLVAAMINVAITGLYVEVVDDGMRLHAWQEAQLGAIQKQLEVINLIPFVVEALRGGQAFFTRTLETTPSTKLGDLFLVYSLFKTHDASRASVLQKIRNTTSAARYAAIPRGWIYQNMAVHAQLVQKLIEGTDVTNQIISPRKHAQGASQIDATFGSLSPYTFIAVVETPNFTRANQRLARNQTMANEALIACALERYRLDHGQYPETLDVLMPKFIEKLPHDIIGGLPLKYHRTDDGKYLLYSVGWNETDDSGKVVMDEGRPSLEQGDWVWMGQK